MPLDELLAKYQPISAQGDDDVIDDVIDDAGVHLCSPTSLSDTSDTTSDGNVYTITHELLHLA